MSSVTIMHQIHSCCTHLQSCTRWYQCLENQNRKLLHLGNEHSLLHQFPCLSRREGMIHSQNSQQHPARSVQNQTQIPCKGRIDVGIMMTLQAREWAVNKTTSTSCCYLNVLVYISMELIMIPSC